MASSITLDGFNISTLLPRRVLQYQGESDEDFEKYKKDLDCAYRSGDGPLLLSIIMDREAKIDAASHQRESIRKLQRRQQQAHHQQQQLNPQQPDLPIYHPPPNRVVNRRTNNPTVRESTRSKTKLRRSPRIRPPCQPKLPTARPPSPSLHQSQQQQQQQQPPLSRQYRTRSQKREIAVELNANIKNSLNNKPPVFVVSGAFVDQKTEEGACCVFLQSNGAQIEGNIASRPLVILRSYDEVVATGIDCEYRFIHDNEHCCNNYVLYAFIGNLTKSEDTIELSNNISDIYSKHKTNIITKGNPHHRSEGKYLADGLKASWGTDTAKSSVGYYKTDKTDALSFMQFQKAQRSVNSSIHQANEYLMKELENDDVIEFAANSSSVPLLNELYSLSSLTQTRPLKTLHHGDNNLHWSSSNFCVDACTMDYHTERDTSMTMILRPYFKPCCTRKCSQCRTTFNFRIPVNGSEELKIPLVDGCVILFSGYLLKHRQENASKESKTTIEGNCDTSFVNISCYSNGRFTHHMLNTAKRVFKATI